MMKGCFDKFLPNILILYFLAFFIYQMKQQQSPVVQLIKGHKLQSSPFLKSYLDYFNLQNIDTFQRASQQAGERLRRQILFDKRTEFIHNMQIQVVSHTSNYQFIDFQVKIGNFIIPQINLVNIRKKSSTHQIQNCSKGSFCSVYKVYSQDEYFAIKCYFIAQFGLALSLYKAINQLCLFKIASLVQAGPKIRKYLGYDIVVYEDCVEFAMEYCQTWIQSVKKNNDVEANLKQNLLNLHSLGFIHFDIKPDNIRYSYEHQRIVFIDFGFSRILAQEPGFKRKTGFIGSLQFCSDEMKQCYILNSEMDIDFYHNDMQSLKHTLNQLSHKKANLLDFDAQFAFQAQSFDMFFEQLLPYLKFLLYKLHITCFQQIFRAYTGFIVNRYALDLISFISLLNYSVLLQNIYQQLLNHRETNSNTRNFRLVKYSPFHKNELKEAIKQTNDELTQNNFRVVVELRNVNLMKSSETQLLPNYTMLKEEDALLNKNWIAQMKTDVYFAKLAKAIQINSNRLSLQEKNLVCKVAVDFLWSEEYEVGQKIQKDYFYLKEVSKKLFFFVLEGDLTIYHYETFLSVIYNIVILNLLSVDQLVNSYHKLVYLAGDYTRKIHMLFRFSTTIIWQLYRQETIRVHADIHQKINQINLNYLKFVRIQKKWSDEQVTLFEMVIIKLSFQNKQYQGQDTEKQISNNMEITRKLCYLLGKDMKIELDNWTNYMRFFMEENNYQKAREKYESYLYSKSFEEQQCFEYFQFFLIFFNLKHRDYIKAKSIALKYKSIFGSLQNFFIDTIIGFIQLKTSNYVGLQEFILKILRDQEKCIANKSISEIIRNNLLEITLVPQFNNLEPQLINKIKASRIFFNYNFQNQPEMFIFQTIYRKIILMEGELRMKTHIPLQTHYSNFVKIYEQERENIQKKSCSICYKHSMMSLNLMLAYLLFLKGQTQSAIEISENAKILQTGTLKFEEKIITIMIRICQNSVQLESRYKTFMMFYFYHKQRSYFSSYYTKNGLISQTYEELYRYCPQQLPHFINKLAEYLKQFYSQFNINLFFALIKKVVSKLKKQTNFFDYQMKILPSLQKIHINPYIGFYLHIILEAATLPISTNILVKISYSLNYVDFYTKSLIQSDLYLKMKENSLHLSPRQVKNLMKKHLKYTSNRLNFNYILSLRLIERIKLQKEYLHKIKYRTMKNCLKFYHRNANNLIS